VLDSAADAHYDGTPRAQFVLPTTLMIEEGRAAHESLKGRQDNACWRSALAALDGHCKGFDLPAKQRLALALSNCHLQDASRKRQPCDAREDVRRCLANISDDTNFGVYTAFFISVESACYYLQSDAWRENTERLISDLDGTAKASLAVQKEVSFRTSALVEDLVHANNVLDGAAESASVMRTAVHRVHEQVSSIQKELADHASVSQQAHEKARNQGLELAELISGMHDFVRGLSSAWATVSSSWYVLWAVNLSVALTTVPFLRAARAPLFAVIGTEILAEQFLRGQWQGLLNKEKLRFACFWFAVAVLAAALFLWLWQQPAAVLRQKQTQTQEQKQKQKHTAACNADTGGGVQPPAQEMVVYGGAEYDTMSRKELQRIAKTRGIPANTTTVVMRSQLKSG
jgi:IS5 family transposase